MWFVRGMRGVKGASITLGVDKFEVLESKTRVLLITKPRIYYNANLFLDKERICLLLVPSNRTESATIFRRHQQ